MCRAGDWGGLTCRLVDVWHWMVVFCCVRPGVAPRTARERVSEHFVLLIQVL
jgi:hypothetical protein